MKTEDSKPVVLHSFNLHLSLEHLQFAQIPFTNWEPVQTHHGIMTFPAIGSTHHTMPNVTNPLPDYSYPAPFANHLIVTSNLHLQDIHNFLVHLVHLLSYHHLPVPQSTRRPDMPHQTQFIMCPDHCAH